MGNRTAGNERHRRIRLGIALVAIAALAIVLAGCGGSSKGAASSSGKPKLTIGAQNFGENQILAYMYAAVANKAGYDSKVSLLGNREVVEPALEKGQLQVVPEYLSTLTEFLNQKQNGTDASQLASSDVDKTFAALGPLAQKAGIKPLTPSKATDQNAFAVTEKFATDNKLTKLSDLASYKGDLVLGGPPECPTRPYCQPGLEKTYGITFTGFKSLDAGGPITKQAIAKGQIQIGLVFSSDGGIGALNLKVLEDDKHLQNADNILPVLNNSVANQGDLVAALDKLSQTLTTDDMVSLNQQVDVEHGDPQKVAETYLRSKGLIS